MAKRRLRTLRGHHRTTLFQFLWAASIGFALAIFGMGIGAAGFFGGSVADGLRMTIEYQPALAILSLSSVAIVALVHWRQRKR